MRIRFVLSVSLCILFHEHLHAQQTAPSKKYIAITFDDLPVVCRCEDNASRHDITDKLLATFKKFNIPVLGVVNEQKLETEGVPDTAKIRLLQKWLDAGQELGNHTYSHQNILDISFDAYKQEILMGERITRPLSQKAGRQFRFYRHPYLSAGNTLQVRKDLDVFLKEHGYIVAPNTITYQDYTFSGVYETALQKGDRALINRIREAYLAYTVERWEAAEQQAQDLFGRDIKQILMVHANRINADFFGDVASTMQRLGYTFITIDEALTDPVYTRPDTYDGDVGVTWLSRWSAEMGRTKSYGSTQVPQFIRDLIKR